jgi:hypothetical protein
MTYVGERTLPIAIFNGTGSSGSTIPVDIPPGVPMQLPGSGDSIYPGFQPGWNASQSTSLASLLQQLISMLQNALGVSGGGDFFQNASASSTGDPHLSFDGTGRHGHHRHSHFDNMRGESDLLHSNSFDGGYRISTMTTQPNANGATYNEEAAVTTGYGGTTVSLERNGMANVRQDGSAFTLADGESLDLGDGESVRRDANGSVYITDTNGNGGSISTVLSENGNGVDVNVQAQNVQLGGDLLRH